MRHRNSWAGSRPILARESGLPLFEEGGHAFEEVGGVKTGSWLTAS